MKTPLTPKLIRYINQDDVKISQNTQDYIYSK